MHKDHDDYFKFTGPSRLEKSVNSLVGLVEGISVDALINNREVDFLRAWVEEQEVVKANHPFNELVPAVSKAISDGVLTEDEKEDILWLGKKLCSTGYFETATSDMQRLHAVLGGIASDGIITETELRGLSSWLGKHEHLKTLWPYDEAVSLASSILADGKIDSDEHRLLMNFFSGFTSILDDKTLANPMVFEGSSVVGLCAIGPKIVFEGSVFCFTGASHEYSRDAFIDLVKSLGGSVSSSVSKKVNYLVIGGDGNPCWAYACYGRKVERAVELRKEGVKLAIIHEKDFHDAVVNLN